MRTTLIIALLILLPFAGMTKSLQVGVDERIELVTAIQLLAGYEYLTEAQIGYKDEVAKAFAAYKDHEVVQYYKAMSGWFYGMPPLSLVLHYELPGFKQTIPYNYEDSAVLRYSQKKDSLERFMQLAQDFYVKSNFHAFYTGHKTFYDKITAPIKAIADAHDFAGIMEQHFGKKQAAYHIILSPLQMDAGFGPMLSGKKGNYLYAIVGPKGDSKDIPDFEGEILYNELVVHEFSHSFCNPMIDRFYDELEKDACLLAPITKAMKQQGYANWISCLYEHLTRANEILLNERIYGKATAQKLQEQMVKEHWKYLDGLVLLLRNEYLPNRKQYPSLAPFMPKVVAYFHRQAASCK
jgi:hypothetical protein